MYDFSLTVILDYLYRYALTLVICLLGSFTRDAYDTMKSGTRINMLKIFASSIFSATIICAAIGYFKLSFSVYVFISFFMGIWSFSILEKAFDTKFVSRFATHFFSAIATPVTKALSDTMKDIEKDEVEEDKEEKDNTNKSDDDDST